MGFLHAGRVSLLLLIGILIFTGSSVEEMTLTDADRKEILSLLFAKELSTPKEKEVVVVLSPRTNEKWPLDLPGIRFKKLGWDEEKQAPEYYELDLRKIRRNYVEVSLSKGNYCWKSGETYRFRKNQGKWTGKAHESFESHAGSGPCRGCEVGWGERVNRVTAEAVRAKEPAKTLLLTGKVLAIKCKRVAKQYSERFTDKYIGCDVDLSLDFVNHDKQPVIILQPHADYDFWLGNTTLAFTKADFEAYKYVYSFGGWPSLYDTDMYRRLAVDLDQPTPPANVTRVLAPGESWNWKTTAFLKFDEENTCSGRTAVKIGWKEIKKLTSPVWMEVSYEMWPFNVERVKKNLGGKLRERWKRHGILYLEEKNSWYWSAHLTSEPIELDLRHVELPL